MKILYFGTVCEIDNYEKLLEKSKVIPSIAPIVFETSLLSGMREIDAYIDIYSYPMIPTFPQFNKLFWGNKKEQLNCGYTCTWLKTINIPIIKQISKQIDGRKAIRRWIQKNKNEKCIILTYSIPPFLVKDIITLSKKYNIKCYAIVTDLLKDMYINSQSNYFISKLKQIYLNYAMQYQGLYDGYICLTEPMMEIIGKNKPYIVMEGIADISNIKQNAIENKSHPRGVMYAGMLHEKYGILNLIEGFMNVPFKDVELWLFGDGNCVNKIKEYCKLDERIRYFGRVPREKILEYEKKATLLVNVRDATDDYTKYSFPSKTIEYMLSGTPVLTTKLDGIPKEYYEFIYSIDNNQSNIITKSLINILCKSKEDNYKFGLAAQKFIIKNKNAAIQAQKIIKFIEEQGEDNEKN